MHKGKRLLRLETDPSRTLWSNSHRDPTDGPVFACLGFAENTPPPWNNNSILPDLKESDFFSATRDEVRHSMHTNEDNKLPGQQEIHNDTSKTRHERFHFENADIELRDLSDIP